ncbi:glycosyltransferase 18 [Striga hermonthica]|uniref:Glycosyltransferase 18 n=1 Tax=Striga hermonthica TaxID=68872 RepID=A0A9N7NCJ3_STRHE|nr:glycosyltransferase 18 [Striga hermonthica]
MNSPEFQTTGKPPNSLNKSLKFFHTQFSSHPRFALLILFLSAQFFVLYFMRLSPSCLAPAVSHRDECPSGKVYVYDLPSKFNKDLLLRNCTDLIHWNWQCGLVTNRGYGGPAVELRGLLPENLAGSWYRTNQFALELIFHHRVLTHKCRTLEPESAAAFYIPFYAGLAVGKHLWQNDTWRRDLPCEEMLRWVKGRRSWKRSNGTDHFMSIGRITWDFRRLTEPAKRWGSSFLNRADMQAVTRFIIEGAPGDPRDVGAPYPTGFHPDDRETVQLWQKFVRERNRSSLFTFIGAARNWVRRDFRALLLRYCKSEPGFCRPVDCDAAQCAANSSVVLEALLGSEFCLQPKGDSFTRRSIFDCMLAGSVPVFFWKRTAYDQYPWFLPGDPESYSVLIEHESVRSGAGVIKRVLTGFSKEEIRRKRETVIETIPRIVYGFGNADFKDAFDIAFDGILGSIKKEKDLRRGFSH